MTEGYAGMTEGYAGMTEGYAGFHDSAVCHSRRFQSGIQGVARWGRTHERTEEKDTGFPLKTAGMTGGAGGNDRGVGGNDKRGMRGRTIPLLSFPTFSIGNPRGGRTHERTEEKDTGFPLKPGGNDREEYAGMTGGAGGVPRFRLSHSRRF